MKPFKATERLPALAPPLLPTNLSPRRRRPSKKNHIVSKPRVPRDRSQRRPEMTPQPLPMVSSRWAIVATMGLLLTAAGFASAGPIAARIGVIAVFVSTTIGLG